MRAAFVQKTIRMLPMQRGAPHDDIDRGYRIDAPYCT